MPRRALARWLRLIRPAILERGRFLASLAKRRSLAVATPAASPLAVRPRRERRSVG
jgi:hypothetical protein